MFIRSKKIKGKEYAYLVINKYNKKKKESRQKTTKYLGKIIDLGSINEQVESNSIDEAIIKTLIKLGFYEQDRFLIKEDISIDLNKLTVTKDNQKVCLKINEGYLCDYTLDNLLRFKEEIKEKKLVHNLAEAFISAGVNIKEDSFVNIFSSKFIKP